MPVYLQIESWIEGLIFERRLAPGAALPSVPALAARLDVSPVTVHKAYRRLQRRGLIRAIVGSGTFVAPLDHRGFVGLLIHREVLAASALSPTVLLYVDMLHRQLAAGGHVDRIVVDNNPRHCGRRAPISADALAMLEGAGLQGVIALMHDGSDELFDLLRRRGLPGIGLSVECRDYDSAIELRQGDYIEAALTWLGRRSLRDVAVMYYDRPEVLDEHRVAHLRRMEVLFDAASVPMVPQWIVGVGRFDERGGYEAFEFLWRGARRPRGLIIVDDVVGRSALTAMVARHVRVPEDLWVCVLSNAGTPLVFPRAWIRWEFDTPAICRRTVELVHDLAGGLRVPKVVPATAGLVADPGEADAPTGPPFAAPGRASFRTADQILSLAADP